MTELPLVAYLLLFIVVGIGFIFVHLVAGKLIRPARPDAEKLTIYECGEPTIGSAWIQFDLRFYVVALLFVIFDVEVAFFFPWAVVFGQANTLARQEMPASANQQEYNRLVDDLVEPAPVPATDRPVSPQEFNETRTAARQLAWIAFWDILVFFGVLLLGFAYLWKRGDLAWVRSTIAERAPVPPTPSEAPPTQSRVLVSSGMGH